MDYLQDGQTLDGRFKIIKKDFAKGGLGQVHLAKDSQGKTVVLKFPHLYLTTQKGLQKFKEEYFNVLKFSHPNVARAYHFGDYQGRFYFASEYIEGKPFLEVAAGLDLKQLVTLFIQALEGLEAIHTSCMLHLDIKSTNILVTKDLKVKIIDFGIATAFHKAPKKVCGTPSYLAPEIALGGKVDNRADLFSFGVLMYAMLASRFPFEKRFQARGEIERLKEIVAGEKKPKPPSKYNFSIPKYLDEIVLSLLAKNPDDRFQTARAVINALKTRHPEPYKESPEALGSYLIPEGNRHMGRSYEQAMIFQSLNDLIKGNPPRLCAFSIEGAAGVGKSHLLRKIKEKAEENIEKISIHFLEVPKRGVGEPLWLKTWSDFLAQNISENKKSILILIDDADVLEANEMILGFLKNIQDRLNSPTLFEDLKPLLLCYTTSKTMAWETQFPFIQRISLRPFSKKETLNYLRATPALNQKKIPSDFLESLYKKTEGNPREIKELLQWQDSKGLLFDLDGKILLAHLEDTSLSFAAEERVPQASQKRFQGLLARLSEFERRSLEILSVWLYRNRVPSVRWHDLQTALEEKDLAPSLNLLVSQGLILHDVRRDAYSFPSYSFLPGLVYGEIEEAKRRELHQKIAKYLKRGGELREAFLFHEAYSGLFPNSLKASLRLSAKLLYERGEAAFVKKLLQDVNTFISPQTKKLKLFWASKLIEACHYAGDFQEAVEIYRNTLEETRQEERPRTLFALLNISILPVLIETENFDKAHAIIDQTLKSIATSSVSHLHLILQNFLARADYRKSFSAKESSRQFLKRAKAIYEKSLAMETRLPPLQRSLIRNNDIGIILQALGLNEKAIPKLADKLKRLKKNPNIFIELGELLALAEAHRMRKNYRKALVFAKKALKVAQQTREGKWIHYAHQILACLHQQMGNLYSLKGKSTAKAHFQMAVQENSCSQAVTVCLENRKDAAARMIPILVGKGQCYLKLEDWKMALANFEASLHYQPSGVYLCYAYLGLSKCSIQKSDFAKAIFYLKKARGAMRGLPAHLLRNCEFDFLKTKARCALLQNEVARLQQFLPKMKALAKRDPELRKEYWIFEREASAGQPL